MKSLRVLLLAAIFGVSLPSYADSSSTIWYFNPGNFTVYEAVPVPEVTPYPGFGVIWRALYGQPLVFGLDGPFEPDHAVRQNLDNHAILTFSNFDVKIGTTLDYQISVTNNLSWTMDTDHDLGMQGNGGTFYNSGTFGKTGVSSSSRTSTVSINFENYDGHVFADVGALEFTGTSKFYTASTFSGTIRFRGETWFGEIDTGAANIELAGGRFIDVSHSSSPTPALRGTNLTWSGGTFAGWFDNGATINAIATGSTKIEEAGAFFNRGTFKVSDGTYDFNPTGIVVSSTFYNSTGGVFEKTGNGVTKLVGNAFADATNGESLIQVDSGTLEFASGKTYFGKTKFSGTGLAKVTNDATFAGLDPSTKNFELAGGVYTGASGGEGSLHGDITWSGGTFYQTFTSKATITALTTGSTKFSDGGAFNNSGTFRVGNGTYDFSPTSAVSTPTFRNYGVFEKMGNGVTKLVGNAFQDATNGASLIQVNSGTLEFASGQTYFGKTKFSGTGLVKVTNDATFAGLDPSTKNFELAGGVYTGANGGEGSLHGDITWSGGTFYQTFTSKATVTALTTGSTKFSDGGAFNNSGTFRVGNGMYDFSPESAMSTPIFRNNGVFEKTGNGVTKLVGNAFQDATNGASLIQVNSGTLEFASGQTYFGKTKFSGTGLVKVTNDATFAGLDPSTKNFELAGGVYTGANGGEGSLHGEITWSGGTFYQTFTSKATITALTTGSTKFSDGGAFNNSGTFRVGNGTYDFNPASAVSTPTFRNYGVFEKTGNGVTKLVGNAFQDATNGASLIQVNSGTLEFASGQTYFGNTRFSGTGLVKVTNNATFAGLDPSTENFELAGGVYTGASGGEGSLHGEITWSGGTFYQTFTSNATITALTTGSTKFSDGGAFNNSGTFKVGNGTYDFSPASAVSTPTFRNYGVFEKTGNGVTKLVGNAFQDATNGASLIQVNSGTLEFASGQTYFGKTRFSGTGLVKVTNNATFAGLDPSTKNFELAGGNYVDATGGEGGIQGEITWSGGTFGYSFTNKATLTVKPTGNTAFIESGYFQNSGTMKGEGTIHGASATLYNLGVLDPKAGGTLALDGNLMQDTSGKIALEITSGVIWSRLEAGGDITLDGELHLTIASGFDFRVAGTFALLTGRTITGDFTDRVLSGAENADDWTFSITRNASDTADVFLATFAPTVAPVSNLYWDLNGAAPGAGKASPNGSWNYASTNWSVNASGTVPTQAWTNGADAVFAAGTDAKSSYTVTLEENLAVGSLTYRGGKAKSVLTISSGSGAELAQADSTMGVSVAEGTTLVVGPAITGTGRLSKTENGTLILTGSNAYTGGTTIHEGVVQIGNSGTSGSIEGDVTNNGSLVFNRSDAYAYAGAISGTGQVVQKGKSALTLSGSNSYSGGTQLASGGLNINSDYALGTGPLTIAAVQTLDNTSGGAVRLQGNNAQYWNANFTFAGSNELNLGGGDVVMNATRIVTVNGSTLTVEGDISATKSTLGLTKAGAGVLVLGGDNTYAGTTTVSGGILRLGTGVSSGSVAGKIVNNGSLEFSRNDVFTVANAISGKGSIHQLGSGTATLSGANSYTGTTTVSAGRLKLGGVKALGKGSLNVAGGTFDLNGFSGTIATLQGASGTIVNDGAALAALTINGAGSSAFAGTLADGDSPLALVKAGKGALTLNGPNTYSGGTTLSSGTLNLGHESALGSGPLAITGAATIDNTSGAAMTLSGAVTQSWNGNFTFKGSSALNLGAGAVTMNGTRTVTVSAGELTVGGSINATKPAYGLTKAGPGTMILAGDNTYAGTTTVSSGTLQIGNSGTSGALGSGKIVNNGALVIDRSDGLEVSNVISGKGTFVVNGDGVVLLEGANTYTGATVLNSGGIQAGSAKALGKGDLVLNGGTISTGGAQHQINVGRNLLWDGAAKIALTLSGDATSEIIAVAGNVQILGDGPLYFDFSTLNLPAGVRSYLVLTAAKGFADVTYADFGFVSDDEDLAGSFRIDGKNLYFDGGNAPVFTPTFTSNAESSGPISTVPEPSAALLVGLGMGLMLVRARHGISGQRRGN